MIFLKIFIILLFSAIIFYSIYLLIKCYLNLIGVNYNTTVIRELISYTEAGEKAIVKYMTEKEIPCTLFLSFHALDAKQIDKYSTLYDFSIYDRTGIIKADITMYHPDYKEDFFTIIKDTSITQLKDGTYLFQGDNIIFEKEEDFPEE